MKALMRCLFSVPWYRLPGTFTGFMTGDPHFCGFEGESFDFMGEPNRYYNLLTDTAVQVNAYFIYWPASGANNFTVTEQIGILVNDHRIQISPAGLTVDGCEIPEIQKVYHIAEGTSASIERFDQLGDRVPEKMRNANGLGNFLRGYAVKTLCGYEFVIIVSTVNVNPPHLNILSKLRRPLAKLMPTGTRRRAYLNTLSTVRRPLAKLMSIGTRRRVYLNILCTLHGPLWPHGIIGQTADHDGVARQGQGPNGEGVIEGTYQDYEVSSLWGSDFKFNKYKTTDGGRSVFLRRVDAAPPRLTA